MSIHSPVNLSAAYIAGLFDGEGSVAASIKRTGQEHVELKITQASRAALDLVAAWCGYGRVVALRRADTTYFEYRIFGARDMLQFIDLIMQHSIIKHEQLTIMRTLLATYNQLRGPIPPSLRTMRHDLIRHIAALKKESLDFHS